jgi:hypothetical protein
MIPAAELAQIRSDVADAALDIPCIIKRKVTTPDGRGSFTESFSTIDTVNVGMTEPSAGQLANYAYLIESLAAWQIKFPYGTDVQHQDHLIINGETLVVQVDLAPRSFASLLTVLASEVK